jgi:hypothetical protein
MLVIPALGRLKQNNCKVKASLNDLAKTLSQNKNQKERGKIVQW